MKNMASAVPQKACPPDGRYPFNITAADAGFTKVKNEGQANQKGGDAQIALSLEIAEGEFAGYPAFDNLGTDGGTTYGSLSKKRLRQLDVPGLDSDAEVPDDVIAASLLNRRVYAEVKREQREDASGQKQFDIDEKTGLKTPLYRLKIIGYLRQPAAGQVQGMPAQQTQAPTAPQQGGFPPPPQGYAPQGYAPPAQPQYAAPQPPPGAPGGWPGQPPQGYAPPAPGAVPGGYAPPAPPQGFPQVAPPQGWALPPNGVPGGAPQQPAQQQGQPGLPFGQPPR